MENIKAVFFDIDGTLVSFNTHKVPESAIDAIARLRQNGIKVFIASGRHKKYINNLGSLEFDGYVTVNGGITMVGDQIIDRHPVDKDNVRAFCHYMDNRPMACAFVTEEDVYLNYRNQQVDEIFDLLNFPQPPMADLHKVAEGDVYQFIAFFTKDDEEEIYRNIPLCASTRWNPMFTDVVPRGISKVMGIQAIERHFGFSRENIMVFGDGGNDVEMLEYAQLGIAMGNADDDVKSYANDVTDTVDNDGISKAIRKHLNI